MDNSSDETFDEFLEDFSGWNITDGDLEEMLSEARSSLDTRLRRLIKQHQYYRFLIRKLIEVAEEIEEDNQIVELAKAAIRTTGTISNHDRQESTRTEEDPSR